MQKLLMGAIATLAIMAAAVSSEAAVVDVGIYIVQDEFSLSEREGVLQDIIDNGGVFTSPATVTIDDILVRNLASFAVITREPVETWGFAPKATFVSYFSDDSGSTFNGIRAWFASSEFDGSLQRGFYAGPDGVLWTADDTEVFGVDPNVDAMVLFGFAVSIDDTLANRVYYIDEIEFDVGVRFATLAYPIPIASGFSDATTTVSTVPEPASIALFMLGMLCVIRRS